MAEGSPNQWERMAFPGKFDWLKERLAAIQIPGIVVILCVALAVMVWIGVTATHRIGTAKCDAWAKAHNHKNLAWDRALELCVGQRTSELPDGKIWDNRPYLVNVETGKMGWVQGPSEKKPPPDLVDQLAEPLWSVLPVGSAETVLCNEWGLLHSAKLTWNSSLNLCVGYGTFTLSDGELWKGRPYRVSLKTGKRAWLGGPPY